MVANAMNRGRLVVSSKSYASRYACINYVPIGSISITADFLNVIKKPTMSGCVPDSRSFMIVSLTIESSESSFGALGCKNVARTRWHSVLKGASFRSGARDDVSLISDSEPSSRKIPLPSSSEPVTTPMPVSAARCSAEARLGT